MSIYQFGLRHFAGSVWGLTLGVVVLGLMGVTCAQATAPAATAINAVVAPYLDGDTTIVMHCDVSKLDVGALEKFAVEMLDLIKVPAEDDSRRDLAAGSLAVEGFIARFKQLGGRDVFGVMAMEDISHDIAHVQFPTNFLVPVGAGGDAKGMIAFFKATRGDADDGVVMELLKPDLIFVGERPGLERLRRIKPVARPDLALGLSGTDAAFEIVGALTADEKRVIREMMPALPAELGGGSTDFLTRDLRQMGLAVWVSPELSVKLSWVDQDVPLLTTNNTPPATPSELGRRIEELRDWVFSKKEIVQELDARITKPVADELRALVKEVLTPKSRIVMAPPNAWHVDSLELDVGQIRAFVRLAGPMLHPEYWAAARGRSVENMRKIITACLAFENKNNELPATLDVLIKTGDVTEYEVQNPADLKHRRYVYQPLPDVVLQSGVPILWEEVDDPASPVSVAYADGHVELIKDHAALEAELKKAADWKAKMEKGRTK